MPRKKVVVEEEFLEEEEAGAEDEVIKTYKPPKGYRLIKEKRSRRLQCLVTPSFYDDVMAYIEGYNSQKPEGKKALTLNNLVNLALEDFMRTHAWSDL